MSHFGSQHGGLNIKMSPLNPVMDWFNRETAYKHPDLAEWRRCQGKAAQYGVFSVIIGSSVAFAGLSLFRPVPKKYIPLVSLCTGAGCGWLVSYSIMTSFLRAARIDSTVADVTQSLEKEESDMPALQESKFGDKNFIKE